MGVGGRKKYVFCYYVWLYVFGKKIFVIFD